MIIDGVRPMPNVTTWSLKQTAKLLKVEVGTLRQVLRKSIRHIAYHETYAIQDNGRPDHIRVPLGSVERLLDDAKAGLILTRAERL